MSLIASRRRFLQSAGGVLAVARAHARTASVLNLAFLGAGPHIAEDLDHASAAGFHIATVCPEVQTPSAGRQILVDPAIHAVCIAAPLSSRARLTLEACRAGKHVWVEAPVCSSLEETRAFLDAAKIHQSVVQCATVLRSAPSLQEARDTVARGQLGAVRFCDIQQPFVPDADILAEQTTHLIDAVHYVLGTSTPASISAQGNQTTRLMTYRHADVIISHRIATSSTRILFYGANATLPWPPGAPSPSPRLAHWRNFHQAIRTRTSPAGDLQAAVRATAVSLMANEALQRGAACALPESQWSLS